MSANANIKNPSKLIARPQSIVGRRHVRSSPGEMRRFTRGYRYGEGNALAVVMPGTLLEQWRLLQACSEAGAAVIAQAANTGLTGGSTPFGDDYDRQIIILNTMRMKCLHVIGGGRQVVCFPGVTLNELEKALVPRGREPHSVIGSSCLGASVLGGIANNSGGSLIHRGPAYTELALFAHVGDDAKLRLITHLNIDLGETAEEILSRLDHQTYRESDVIYDDGKRASGTDYAQHVRDIDAPTPARFNADTRRLFEASGSSGKVITFAVRIDTFEAQKNARVFYVGTDDPDDLTNLRRAMLTGFATLPISAEYIHRDAYDVASCYGKDTFLLIKYLGTGRLPKLFALKSRIDGFAEGIRFLPGNFSDRVLQCLSKLFPQHLPKRMNDFRNRFQHHLMIKVADEGVSETRDYLARHFTKDGAAYFECDGAEGTAAFLHRFAVAGAAVRYRAVHGVEVGGVVALDIALPRNAKHRMEVLPSSFDEKLLKRLYYGHFFCHVFHQDYIICKGVDWLAVEHEMLARLDERGAKFPAEHNVGHLYAAEPVVAEHYQKLDPCNCFNPGIGQTSKLLRWRPANLEPLNLPSNH